MKKNQKLNFKLGKHSIVKGKIGKGTVIWNYINIMEGSEIGENCIICDYVFIEKGVKIGNNVIVKNGAQIWKGVTIEDNVFIGPGVIFINDKYPRSKIVKQLEKRYSPSEPYRVEEKEWLEKTIVKNGAAIGANATILCGITIGKFAMVGAGSVVTKDVPPYSVIAGNPGRIIKKDIRK